MFKNANEIEITLLELLDILDKENERRWSKVIKSALSYINTGTEDDYESARSIYYSMCNGGRGFMEYYIERDDFQEQLRANNEFDLVRSKVWKLFSL